MMNVMPAMMVTISISMKATIVVLVSNHVLLVTLMMKMDIAPSVMKYVNPALDSLKMIVSNAVLVYPK
jgi:hypothetical protein